MCAVVVVVGCGEQTGGSEIRDVSSPEIPEIDGEDWVLPELEQDPGEDLVLSEVESASGSGLGLPEVGSSVGEGVGLPDVVVDTGAGVGDVVVGDQLGPLRFEPESYGAVGFNLGYLDPWDGEEEYVVESPRDEVVVLVDSVLVRDGVLRGLVQNMSAGLFARGVTVSVDENRWEFPLTVQPSEIAPFVIEDYGGSLDPEIIEFEVQAVLTPVPDPSRSFEIVGLPGHQQGTWSEFQARFPGFALNYPPVDPAPDEEFYFYSTLVELHVPTSHPNIADEVMSQTIDDLEVYEIMTDADGRVMDVLELVPYVHLPTGVGDDGEENWGYVEVAGLPFVHPYQPEVQYTGFFVGTMRLGQIMVGGPHNTAG